MKNAHLISSVTVIALSLISSPAFAYKNDKPLTGFISIGAFAKPDYAGSDDYDAAPLLAGKVNYGDYYVETKGLGLRANISSLNSVEFGPAIAYRFGRDDDVDNARVKRLREIDDAFEAGAFIKVPFNGVLKPRDQVAFSIDALTDISGAHDGTLVSFGTSYSYSPADQWRLTTSLSATYADDDFMESYFSVDTDNAARSDLSAYHAEGGFKDVGVALIGNYQMTDRWGLTAIAGYTKMLGDAADSPIVNQEGNDNQFMGGLGLSYSF